MRRAVACRAASRASARRAAPLLFRDDQGVAEGVVELRPLAEEDDRDGRAEDRDQVEERTGAVGADQLNAAVETDIGDQRREDHDVGQHCKGRRGRIDPAAGQELGNGDGRQHDRTGNEGDSKE